MFDLHKLKINNFRSYKGKHEISFPTINGLYFLTGKNIAQPALGANGAGKSTLLDAITWVLFGCTTRGLKAAEVVSWGLTSCQCALELTVGAQRLKIKRTQSPNGLFLDEKPVDQKELQKHIRLNFDSFLYSVINAQFGQSFLSLQSSAKLSLFSDVMELNFWLEKSDEAATLSKEFKEQAETLRTTIARHEGQMITVTDDIEALEEKAASFETERLRQRGLLGKQSKDIYAEEKSLLGRQAHLKHKKQTLLKELETWNNDVVALIEKRDDFLDKIELCSRKRSEWKNEEKNLKDKLHNLPGSDDECPVCLQNVTARHLHSTRVFINSKLIGLEGTFKNSDAVLADLTKEMIRARGHLSAKESSATEIRSDISEVDTEVTITKTKLAAIKTRLDDIGYQLHTLEQGENPHNAMLEAKKAALKKLKASVIEDVATLHKAEAGYEAISYWIKGFKRVRLFIIEQAFRTLELEINNSLAQLGMTDWEITFDIERENKSGGITKGFIAFVQGPSNAEPVRWENWSGGETQRLQLAGDLGLANLIMQQNGLVNTIEFFDEPSTHLSQEGMHDLANMLHERAVSEGKRIWIVDHTAITNFGEFEGIITAGKDAHGSDITITAN